MAKKKDAAALKPPAETGQKPTSPVRPPAPRTLRESANQFLADIGHILYTRNKKLGDLMAIEKEVANLLNIGHPILDEPVE